MSNEQKTQSIFRTLTWSFLLVCLTALGFAGLVQIYILTETNHRSIAKNQELLAKQAAVRVENYLEHKFAVIETGLSILRWGAKDTDQCKVVLESLIGVERSFKHLVCFDREGKIRAALSRHSQGSLDQFTQSVEQNVLQQAQQKKRFISSVHVDKVTFEPLIVLGSKIKNVFGETEGLFLAEVNLKFMWNLVARLDKGHAGQSYVVDNDGLLLAAKDSGRVIRGEHLHAIPLVASFMQNSKNGQTKFYKGIDGKWVIGTAVPLSYPDWAVITELPVMIAYKKVILSIVFTAIFFLLLAIASTFVAAWASRRVVNPLVRLTETASLIAHSQTIEQALVEGPTEIRTLAGTFNVMTERLLKKTSELQKEINQRTTIEEQLRQSEERFDLALMAVNEGIWDWDLVSKDVHFDDRWYTMCGYKPGEFPNEFSQWEKRVHPDDVQSVKELVHLCLIGVEESFSAEFRFLQKDDTYRWLLGRGMIVKRDEQGQGVRFVGTHLDISDRKAAEQQLRDSEEKLRLYLDNTHDGVFIINPDHSFAYVNLELGNILGYEPAELIGELYGQFLHRDSFALVTQRNKARSLGAEVPPRYEITIERRDGERRDAEISVDMTVDSKGDLITIGTLLDITERKTAEQEAHRLRSLLGNIINSMPSMLVGVDDKGRVTQWNRTVEQVTGVTAEAARGQLLIEVFPQMEIELANIRKSVDTRSTIVEQKRAGFIDADGYVDVTIYPLISNGVEGAVIRIDDVTEKVRLEEMMIQSEKMLSVGGLAAGMAHEINNPLAGMLQTAEVMSNRLGNNMNFPANVKAAEQAGTTVSAIDAFMKARGIYRMIETIRQSGTRVADIVENMLSFARKSEASISTCSLEEIFEKTIALAATDYDLKQSYDFKLIIIERDYGEQVPAVPCERAKIQQVLLNILRNGAQAMQAADTQHPTFTVRTRYEVARSLVVLEIEDNGPGMDEQARKRAFEPFYTTKPVGVGTGLGLSVSYFIITENHKGEMSVVSAPGKGSRFIIRLPV